ncbi:ADP-ribosylglycohydrolase family protein [Deinococcus sp. KSM4-11]|uniref:ADP-ribosylglycohydrolase family protein n=1 Tax=Deinococcus sp. KSM4-11 TaxID=2568654 RepID=UPI0010A37DAF|nr:ADP-ribosylglycohydrolase family protein [Deinococcus sp. KSM4-11]THF87152.1 ADP-ribosylglycohydrolase family protein [Deinococcus sp. KSM4-11]
MNHVVPADYLERVYAGVLGKIIGVSLGRPVEGWSYARITETFGELDRYVHGHRDWPLILPDDDLTGTFTFLRTLERVAAEAVTAADIGDTWLDQIVEGRTCLWWGGFGNSTEQTAYHRLTAGLRAPLSGSAEVNGRTVAEQIGAQIFIDGWAMVAPGRPDLAARLARAAAQVSHDGAAVDAAVALATMEALAFVESDLDTLLDAAQAALPEGGVLARLYREVRAWHREEPEWARARQRLEASYGYDRYPGNVHVIPNHGVILLALLYGAGDLRRSLVIANTCGWDTDCNAGNVGCLLAIRGGLAALNAVRDWRDPLADRLYLPGPEGGRAITDALTVAVEVASHGLALSGEAPLAFKDGAQFHFCAPGAVQGWLGDGLTLENVAGHSRLGSRSLALHYPGRSAWARVATFLPPEVPEPPDTPFARGPGGGFNYTLLASPRVYPGQEVHAELEADTTNAEAVTMHLMVRQYDGDDTLVALPGPSVTAAPGERVTVSWRVPDLDGLPIAELGLEVSSGQPGTVYLDSVRWHGAPTVTLGRPSGGGEGRMWRRAWVNAVEKIDIRAPEPYRLLHAGTGGAVSTGSREWTDYEVSAELTVPVGRRAGLAARFRGLHSYYALFIQRGAVTLIRARPGQAERLLAEAPLDGDLERRHLRLVVSGPHVQGFVDGTLVVEARDGEAPILSGGIALLIDEGWLSSGDVTVSPVT